jgi:hypothetical protein
MLPDYKKQVYLLVPFCFFLTLCSGQQKEHSFRFHSINQVGLLTGETGSAWQLQTVNGFQYKSWFGGIGAGLDYYRFRGIPLFADIRKTFGHAKSKPFIYADGGIHFRWLTDKEKINYGSPGKYSNGLYLDGGLGYQIYINRKNALLLNLGYSYKDIKGRFSPYLYYPTAFLVGDQQFIPPTPLSNSYNYRLNRISIKLGWEF